MPKTRVQNVPVLSVEQAANNGIKQALEIATIALLRAEDNADRLRSKKVLRQLTDVRVRLVDLAGDASARYWGSRKIARTKGVARSRRSA